MNRKRVTETHCEHLREVQRRSDVATDPGSPGGTAIVPCELPDIIELLAGTYAEAKVIQHTDDLRATSPERLDAKLTELKAWSERLPLPPAA